jgi:hypothetical protein
MITSLQALASHNATTSDKMNDEMQLIIARVYYGKQARKLEPPVQESLFFNKIT